MTASREMPKYQCHKKVWALKIKDVTYDRPPLEGVPRGNATITPEDEGYEPFVVDEVWAMKNRPQPGGYYVAYEDGYKSYSPAPAFEAGYLPCNAMTFGLAVEALKKGLRVARACWNGKGMWLFLIQGSNDLAKLHGYGFGEALGEPAFRDAIFMRTVDNQLVAWTASQTDVLAEDWVIVE